MATLFPPRYTVFFGLLLIGAILTGCSHNKTNRGHLFRCDWAFEYNRTPWVGCPPDSGCDDENDSHCSDCNGGGSCLKHKGFRRHCGLNSDCTAKNPCCKSLGCGMWIDPSDPNAFASQSLQNQGIKACGLTPFCSPMKPCGLTPICGRAVNQSYMNQQALMLGNLGGNTNGITTNPLANPTLNPVLPTPIPGKKSGTNVQGSPSGNSTVPAQPGAKTVPGQPMIARPGTPLISMGVVPGISRVTTGGTVVASGVTTSFGRMTAMGVQLPNGTISNEVVIRACCSNGNCLPSRPCGIVPGCGGLVSLAAVTRIPASHLNNVMLASGYQMQGVQGSAGQVVQAGGRLINPMTGLPVYGLTMSGYPQAGYPPIGYAPTGYAPGYPQQNQPQDQQQAMLAANAMLLEEQLSGEEIEEEQEESVLPVSEPKSSMPVPRFYPIPTKPAFQRSEGLPLQSGSAKKTAALSRKFFSDRVEEETNETEEPQSDAELAYLAGMAAAMDQVEEELGSRERNLEKKRQQEILVKRAEELQAKIDRQRQEEARLEQEKAERDERLQAQLIEEQSIKEEERSAWEEAVQLQLAESKHREERLKKQLRQQQVQIQKQAELNEMLAVQQIPFVPQDVPPMQPMVAQTLRRTQRLPSVGQVQPVHFAASGQNGGQVASIPTVVPAQGANMQPLFTPVREVGGLFESALNYLKGEDAPPPKQRSQQTQQYRQYNTVAVQSPSEDRLLQPAKSAGSGLLSAVNGVVSPLSGLLGSSEPMETQQSVQHSVSAAKPVQRSVPMPIQPPVLRAPRKDLPTTLPMGLPTQSVADSLESFDFSEELELPKPTRPPTAPKKVKRAVMNDEDDTPVIRQVNFFE